MPTTQAPLGIDLSDAKFITPQQFETSSQDLVELLGNAFDQPMDFPRLRDSVFPGDKLVVVLHADLPQPQEIVRAIAKYLDATEIESADVSYVTAVDIPTDGDDCPEISVHDPENERAVAYIAANLEGLPVVVNRVLFEADVVLPVCTATTVAEKIEDCIYPRFSSSETKSRYRDEKNSANSRALEIEAANNGLGVFQSLQIVSSPGCEISEAFFGQRDLAEQASLEKSSASWAVELTDKADAVVATIESLSNRQNWDHFFQAIISANRAVTECDNLVVLCELGEKPNKRVQAMLQLQFEMDPDAVNRVLKKASEVEKEVAEIMREKTVYLKSRLSESVVEGLGIGFIKSDDELQRLLGRFESAVLLRDAQFCRVKG